MLRLEYRSLGRNVAIERAAPPAMHCTYRYRTDAGYLEAAVALVPLPVERLGP